MTYHYGFSVPEPKMDTPTGLYSPACSCGWRSTAILTENGAERAAKQHAKAKSAQPEYSYNEHMRYYSGWEADMVPEGGKIFYHHDGKLYSAMGTFIERLSLEEAGETAGLINAAIRRGLPPGGIS